MSQISADPSDINVLPEYSDDPRVVQNLLDGVNRTRDDLHMWLAPFFPGRPHTVTLTFTSNTILAMVRIWVSATVPLYMLCQTTYSVCVKAGISPMHLKIWQIIFLYAIFSYVQNVIFTEGQTLSINIK